MARACEAVNADEKPKAENSSANRPARNGHSPYEMAALGGRRGRQWSLIVLCCGNLESAEAILRAGGRAEAAIKAAAHHRQPSSCRRGISHAVGGGLARCTWAMRWKMKKSAEAKQKAQQAEAIGEYQFYRVADDDQQ